MKKDKHPNEALRYHRLLRGWSQTKVADEIGASNEMISKWEGGQKKTSSFYQEKLCALFGKNAEELGFLHQVIARATDETTQSFSEKTSQRWSLHIEQSENPNMDPLRRTITAALVSLLGGTPHPLEWWERLAHPHPSVMNTEAFTYFQQLLECGWRLSNTGELHAAEQVVMSFLPRMFQLAPYKKEAASIAAEGLRLQGILAAHQQKMLDKLTICLQSVEFARQTNNPDILIAQLTELAVAFRYAHQSANSFRIYQEALSYCQQGQISPLVRSRIYAASAPTFAMNGHVKEAKSLIEKAYDSFPSKLDSEPSAFSADNQLFMVDYYQGLLHLVLNQPEKAYQTFEQATMRSYESQIPERWRLIILNYQGLAATLSRQLDQYSKCLQEGLSGSITLGSKKRLDEAVSIYQHYVPQKWKNESCIKQLQERFLLEQESRREEELEIW